MKLRYPTKEEFEFFEMIRTAGTLADTLEEFYGLKNHPKASTLFNLAWDEGHASGIHEVIFWYIELAELID